MQTLIYDTDTKTVLETNDRTHIYIDPSEATVTNIHEGKPDLTEMMFYGTLRLFPNAGASPASLYRSVADAQKYLDKLTATAGRSLMVRLARRIKELHNDTKLVDLDSLYFSFVHTPSNEGVADYQIESLAGDNDVVLLNAESMQTMIQNVLGHVPDFTLHELAAYIDTSDAPVVRLPNMTTMSPDSWDPDDPSNLPKTVIVCLADLLEINQRV